MAVPVKLALRVASLGLSAYVALVALTAGLPALVMYGLLLGAGIGAFLALHPNPKAQSIGFVVIVASFGAALTLPLMVIIVLVAAIFLIGVMK